LQLRLIIGRAGTGKTRACLNEVRKELLAGPSGAPLILLVPEQATFQMEYALAATPGLKGFTRAQVLSFRRLAYRVLQKAGGAARKHIGELGKRMVLRRLLEQRKDQLKVFRRSAEQPGFAGTLAGTLGEMKTYCVAPAELERAASRLREKGSNLSLADKLEDIYLLYNDLEAYLDGRFIDPEDYLNLLAERMETSGDIGTAEVWVDGFTGFTPQEYKVLAALMRTARRVNVTLGADFNSLGGIPDDTDLFYPVRETYEKLCATAAGEGIIVARPLILDGTAPRRFNSPDIACLEKHYFNHRAKPRSGTVKGVVLACAANTLAEAEGVAREITALCRDRGYRYRDIVIILRDLETYAQIIKRVFSDHGIPVFIDQKRSVLYHPLVELVRSALEVVAGNWPNDPVFRFLKTDLVPLAREKVDLLENYVLAHGIRGNRWIDGKPWEYVRRLSLEEDREVTEFEARELKEINVIRQQAVTALDGFYEAMGRAANVREITGVLFNLLEKLKVPTTLEKWSRKAEERGQLENAREHVQVWDGLISLLDQIVEALGDDKLTPGEYNAVLESGFESLRLGLIPPGLDQVVVGSLDRSRLPEARVAFIMGVNDGVLPARIKEQGIISEGERDGLKTAGINLAPGARRRALDEQYLTYIALSRASELLYLSYPAADDEGGALMPSRVIERVKELLPDVGQRVWPMEPNPALADDLDFIAGADRALSYLAAQLREAKAGRPVNPLWWDLYLWFIRGSQREKCARVLSALFFTNREERLPPGTGRELYGRTLKTSVSGMEKFIACPFAHFLSRGLKLKEREAFKLDAPDLGRFFHAALKLFGDRVRAEGLEWGALNKEQIGSMAGETVDLLAPRLQNEILLSTARRRYLTGKLKRTVHRAALVLAEHSRRGSFRPVGLELAFGPGGDLPAVTFTLAGGTEMILTGRIDRVDAAVGDEGIYLRVIDYKSGRMTVKLSDIYHGLKMQLMAYLDVALRHAGLLLTRCEHNYSKRVLPGAVLYFRIDDPLVKTDGGIPPEEEREKKILKELRMTGMVLSDPAVARLMDGSIKGQSDLIPVYIKSSGDFADRSAVLTREQFDLLRVYLRSKFISAGNDIMSGVIDISPYRHGNSGSCLNCPYKPVCQFDILVEGNKYRVIKEEEESVIWDLLSGSKGGEFNE